MCVSGLDCVAVVAYSGPMWNTFEDPEDVPAREAYMEQRFDVADIDEAIDNAIDDEPWDEGYYYSGTGEWSEDDSYIDYLNRD